MADKSIVAAAITSRKPKFINIEQLYVARRTPDPSGPRFIMELTAEDITTILVGLSKLLPDDLKLVSLESLDGPLDWPQDLDDETIADVHALGDSAREILIRATQPGQHCHMWDALLSPLDADATLAEQAATMYANEIAGERPDEVDEVATQAQEPPDLDAEPAQITLGPDGVTIPGCGTITDT